MLADGGQAIADLAVLRGQDELFGPVASASTVWRLLNALDDAALVRLRAARARAREVARAQAGETGHWQASSVAGPTIPGLVLDVDATIVICQSDKELASKTCRRRSAITRCSAFWTTPVRPSGAVKRPALVLLCAAGRLVGGWRMVMKSR